MGNRRGRGEGTITQRSDGRWQVRVPLGRDAHGRRLRKYAYGATEADAVDELRRLGGRAVEGQLLTTSTPTVGAYLEDWYATNLDGWRPSTQRCYRRALDGFLVPAFGTLRLEQLSPQLIQRWLLRQKAEHGARRRIALAHATLRSALAEAQRLQIVSLNAARLVRVPRPAKKPIRPLTVDEAKAFLDKADAHPLSALFSVALACGLRIGEATGLQWPNVNLETGEVAIRQQLQLVKKKLVLLELKTEKSRRTLVLPAVCIAALKEHRTRQLERRLKAGARWVETGLVFTTYRTYQEGKGEHRQVGAGLEPRNVRRVLDALLKEAGLPHVRFHDLRHSAASLLIARGVQLVEVSQLLGHSELRVTADLYAHLLRDTAAKAATIMDDVLRR